MNKENKIFEDLSKLAGSAMDTAFNSINDMKSQFEQTIHAKIDDVLQKHNLVSREEFEVVKEIAQKALLQQEKLEKKIASLEKKLKATK